jgi:septal ring factor EnvC (AmiA/AmiB activator)
LTFTPAVAASDSESKKSQIKKIETDLSREREQLLRFGKKEKELLGQLSNLEKEIAEKKRFLKAFKKKIGLGKKELNIGQKRLREFEHSLNEVEDRLSKRLVAFYKYAKKGYMQILATSGDLEQLRKRMKYLKVIMSEDQKLFRQMARMQQNHKREISLTEEKIAVIEDMENEERSRLLSIKKDLDKKVMLLMRIHKEKEFYETAVKELQIAAKNLKMTLLNLDKKQEKKKRLPSGFAASKGKLPLPAQGKVIKNYTLPEVGSQNTLKGLYIEGHSDAEVKAVFAGRVDFSGWLKGYGQIIVINHGSRFFTVSAQLSEREKEEGEMVKKGETIGLLGRTESSAGSRLYFEIRRGGVNLDPFRWLKVD